MNVPASQDAERPVQLAQMAAALPPFAVRAVKRAPAYGVDLSLDAALLLENREFLLLFDAHDKTEGRAPFSPNVPRNSPALEDRLG